MSTIITKNSATSGSTPSSLVQGELAINVTDGRLFYGSGSGNVVKEFVVSGSGGTTFPYTGSAIISGSLTVTGSLRVTGGITGSFLGTASYATNALSASYAPSSPAFPFTGSALITGSLRITGSLSNGDGNIASGIFSHAEGDSTISSGSNSHAEGASTISYGLFSHAEGLFSQAIGEGSHAEGYDTRATAYQSHAEGQASQATGNYSHAEGDTTISLGDHSHSEGQNTITSGSHSHAEGNATQAIGLGSHAEGTQTKTGGTNGYLAISIVSGLVTLSGSYGNVSTDYPSGNYLYLNDLDYDGVYPINSFVINSAIFNGTETKIQLIDVSVTTTTAVVGNLNLGAYNWTGDQIYKGPYSHAEGVSTQAMGFYSHAEGEAVQAAGGGSHAEGYNTVAAGNYQHVQGQYNAISSSPSAFILGNGTADNARSNLIFASGSQVQITGSIIATSGFTGSLLGTASYATQALSASYALTASYATNGGVTQIIAGPNITVSPTTGVGQVTISSTGGGGGTGNTATGSYGSFYSTQTQTNVASTARSMSLNTTDITNGVSISGSTNPYNTYIKTENAGVYDIQFSAQVDKTDSGTDEIWIWLRKNGINVTDSATSIQLVGNGAHYVAAWNFFVNAAANDYFQLMWYSPDANVRLHAEAGFGVVPGIPSLIVTANRVDQFLSNTGSFSGSFTGNLIGTSSWASNSITASYIQTAQTASYVLQAVSASFTTTSSYSNTSTSASFALSASYAPSTPAFPYTGSAVITGSLRVTGSFSIQTFDGVNYVPAISLSNFSRAIYDVMGTSSFDADGRILFDDMGIFAANWSGRTLLDSTGTAISLNWGSKLLYDTISSQSIDWANRLAYDTSGTNYSIDWSSRLLADQSGFDVLSWDAITNNYKIDASTYLKKSIGSNTQESFSNVPATTFNYEGEVITGQLDGAAALFDLVYLETDGKWHPVTQATADCSKLLGICASTGGGARIILEGSITVNDGTYTDTPLVQLIDHGLPIYIRESAGNTMSTNVPTTAGQYVRILGHAYYQNTDTTEYWIMKFRPSHEWIEL